MTDYYSILMRAVGTLDPNTKSARAKVYIRARQVIQTELRAKTPSWSDRAIAEEEASFEAAVKRVEINIKLGGAIAEEEASFEAAVKRVEINIKLGGATGFVDQTAGREMPVRDRPSIYSDTHQKRRLSRHLLFSIVGVVAAALIIGAASYAYIAASPPTLVAGTGNVSDQSSVNRSSSIRRADTILNAEELAPGIDGGSSDSGLPYFYRRQPVYYRTVYSVGMVVVERSQRYLYLVQPKIVALRYGIGIGRDCSFDVGLHRITRKEEWPEWVPAAEQVRRRKYPPRMSGMPGNPLGSRALFLDNVAIGIHGTNSPKTIGHAVTFGCFRMVNDDVTDLFNRVGIETVVVVLN